VLRALEGDQQDAGATGQQRREGRGVAPAHLGRQGNQCGAVVGGQRGIEQRRSERAGVAFQDLERTGRVPHERPVRCAGRPRAVFAEELLDRKPAQLSADDWVAAHGEPEHVEALAAPGHVDVRVRQDPESVSPALEERVDARLVEADLSPLAAFVPDRRVQRGTARDQ